MNGFIMFWNEVLLDTSLTTEEAVFYCYLESVEDYFTDKKTIDGKRYTRLSYDMLVDRFRTAHKNRTIPMSRPKIIKMFNKLVERKYIEKINEDFSHGPVYYRCVNNMHRQYKDETKSSTPKKTDRKAGYESTGVASRCQTIN